MRTMSLRSGRGILSAVLILFAACPAFCGDSGSNPSKPNEITLFPRDLGRNFLALFDRRNVVPFLVGGAASGGVAFLDHRIQDNWAVKDGSSLMGSIGATAGGAPVVLPAVAALFVLGHYSRNDRFQSFTYALAQGEVLDLGLVEGIKVAGRRERPDASDRYSFPSGHAASSFMIATVTAHYYGWRAGVLGYAAASFIAASRSRENKHWASDLAAGATIGYIVGSTVSRRTGLSLRIRKVVLLPSVDLPHRVFGIALGGDQN